MKNVNLISSSSHKKEGRIYYQITKNTEKQRLILAFCKGFRYLFPKKNYFTSLKMIKMKLTRIFVPIVASLVLYSCASNNLSYEGKAFKTAYESIKADELKKT